MRAITLLRCAGLAVLLAVALPAPASPQLGKFIKKAIKQKIANQVEQTVLGSDSTTTAPAAGSGTAPGAPGAPRARKGAPVQVGPVFTEHTLEITPALLDRFEKGLAAEQADRNAAAAEAARILSQDEYRKCEQAVYTSAEGQKAYQEYAATPKDDMTAVQKASEVYSRRLDELKKPKCGPGGNEAVSARYQLSQRPLKAGQAASGLTEYQYAILRERIIPFCGLPQPPAPATGGETRIAAASAYTPGLAYVYAPGEVAALGGRCPRLMAALNPPQAGTQAPANARKKAPVGR